MLLMSTVKSYMIVLHAIQNFVDGTLCTDTRFHHYIVMFCLSKQMLDMMFQSVWKFPIINTTLPYKCSCFHTISVALVNKAWSNTTAIFSSRSEDILYKELPVLCTYLWLIHLWWVSNQQHLLPLSNKSLLWCSTLSMMWLPYQIGLANKSLTTPSFYALHINRYHNMGNLLVWLQVDLLFFQHCRPEAICQVWIDCICFSDKRSLLWWKTWQLFWLHYNLIDSMCGSSST